MPPASSNRSPTSENAKRAQQQMNGDASNKKQATPSQKRLQKQQRQQQQQGQINGNQQGPQTATAKTNNNTSKTRELDVKVDKLTDKNECCKLKISSRLEEFSKKASEIKSDIETALGRQQKRLDNDQNVLDSVEKLRGRLEEFAKIAPQEDTSTEASQSGDSGLVAEPLPETSNEPSQEKTDDLSAASSEGASATTATVASDGQCQSGGILEAKSGEDPVELRVPDQVPASASDNSTNLNPVSNGEATTQGGCFEPLSARLDPKSKFVALKASLEKQFNDEKAPGVLLEPICNKLIDMSRQVDQLKLQNECQQQEIGKLRLIKERLADLCRELQKSNNQIRIESLGLIKSEQHKAKEQADKIQTTLAGVMKLFDENQQRNLSLKQENIDLQLKLKQLLEHCENWEQCVETAIKQRDIENRLVKTELARLALVRTEEQERFLKEKHDLLKALETMKSHQSRVEDKEAKLRSDLTSYATKYDQCQELIQNGLGKFQVESKRMLKQIERSRQDYVTLLNKYEASNKKIKQLLEEKQAWMKSTTQANKKLETLEKLCRSLKSENDRLTREAAGEGADRQKQTLTTTTTANTSNEATGTSTSTTGEPVTEPTSRRVPLVVINDQPQG